MSKLEDLKTEFGSMVDEAWHALEGSADVERARELVHQATADLKAKVEDIAEHIFYHVVGNAEQPAAPESPAPAPVETVPAESAPAAPVEQPTGMAPAAGDGTAAPAAETPAPEAAPAADALVPAADAAAETSQEG